METKKPVFTRETFQFFKDLGRHNHKEWMEANRDRYQATLIQPFRRLLEELAPAVLELDSRFDTSGRIGANFSRINRDIRFAKDKTLYKTHMYLKFRSAAGQAGNRPALCWPHNGHSHGGFPHLFGREAERVHDCADRRTTRDGRFTLGSKAKNAPWPALRKLLVQDGEGGMDEALRLARFG